MSDEQSLPRLPGVSWDEQSQSFSNNPRKRVRARSRGSPALPWNSSDPAIFSSDDDQGLDNYVQGRHKKRYVGSWFQQQPASSDSAFSDGSFAMKPRAKKRTLARQADSGVFLGSDGTESEDMAENLEIPVRPKLRLERRPRRHVSKAELAAQDKIRACIEQGDESLDLWSMGLEELSGETVSRLSQFSCIPIVAKDVAFEQKDPELKIYLAMNRLTRIPGALFDLSHITILSLRGNQLTDLPPGVSRLRNLQELNVSQNRLRHLPTELFDLIDDAKSLKTLIIHPNPFLQPDREFGVLRARRTGLDLTAWASSAAQDAPRRPRFLSRRLGRSPLQFSSSRGTKGPGFTIPTEWTSEPIPIEVPPTNDSSVSGPVSAASSLKQSDGRPSRVPSLLETALQSCYQSDELPELEFYVPEDLSHLRNMLHRATQQKEVGGLMCSRCRRLLVTPPLEWVEWRQLATCSKLPTPAEGRSGWVLDPHSKAEGEMAVPFLHRGCSWRCGPDDGDVGQWKVGTGWNVLLRESEYAEWDA